MAVANPDIGPAEVAADVPESIAVSFALTLTDDRLKTASCGRINEFFRCIV